MGDERPGVAWVVKRGPRVIDTIRARCWADARTEAHLMWGDGIEVQSVASYEFDQSEVRRKAAALRRRYEQS